MAAKRHFWHFCHVFLLFGTFKEIFSKCLSWFYVYWFLKLLIQQKCWYQQKKLLTSAIFSIMYFYVWGHFEYFYFCWFSSFWSKIAEMSSIYIRVYSFSWSFWPSFFFFFFAGDIYRSWLRVYPLFFRSFAFSFFALYVTEC